MLKIKVSQSVWLVGGVPILGALVLLVMVFSYLNQNVISQNTNLSLFSLSERLGRVAHNFAVERGLTAGFVNSKNENDANNARSKLDDQRRVAEQVAQSMLTLNPADFPGIEPAELNKIIRPVQELLNRRQTVRQQVNSLNPDANAFAYYSDLNARALDGIQYLLVKIKDPEIATNLETQLSLFWMKERVGQYRGLLNGVFAKGSISPIQLNMVKSYLSDEFHWLRLFEMSAQDKIQQQLASGMNTPVWKSVTEIAQKVANTAQAGDVQGPPNWFSMATEKIATIQKITIEVDDITRKTAEGKASDARFMLYLVIGISLVIVIPVVLFMIYISRSITSRVKQIHHYLHLVTQRDLTSRFTDNGRDELSEISLAINQHLDSLSGSFSLLHEQAMESKESVVQIENRNKQTLQKTQEQFSRIDQIAAAAEEMYQTSQSIAQDIHSAAQEAESMQGEATTGQERMIQIFDLIKQLSTEVASGYQRVSDVTNHTNDIGTILQTIEDIAEQTNLLALNAAIEAARAGEQGRGFAVVADEVRNLAHRTQNSTEEIRTMIQTLVSSGNSALSLMKQCNQMSEDTAGVVNENQSMMDHLFKSINSISQTVELIATAVEEQSQTTKDINQNIQYINELSHHITEVVNQMNDSVKDSSKRADDVIDEINSYRC